MREVSTPSRRNSPSAASAIGCFSGSTVTNAAGIPSSASATATFASPPPNVAMSCGVCRNRSKPGGASRSMISPKVTVSLAISRLGSRAANPFGKLARQAGDRTVIALPRAACQITADANRYATCPNPFLDVIQSHAAGRHQGGLRQRPAHCLHERRSQHFSGKYLYYVRSRFHAVHYLADGGRSRHVRHLVPIAQSRGCCVEGGADHVLRARENG